MQAPCDRGAVDLRRSHVSLDLITANKKCHPSVEGCGLSVNAIQTVKPRITGTGETRIALIQRSPVARSCPSAKIFAGFAPRAWYVPRWVACRGMPNRWENERSPYRLVDAGDCA